MAADKGTICTQLRAFSCSRSLIVMGGFRLSQMTTDARAVVPVQGIVDGHSASKALIPIHVLP